MATPFRSTARSRIALGVALALAGVEGGARVMDGGARPDLSVFEPDAALGVRLRPGADERLAGAPASRVQVNADGYRGAPAADGIALVGDEQAFGVGVDDDATTAAALARRTGRPVRNLGVPTYGPPEYLHVVRQLRDDGHTDAIVVLVDARTDRAERARPNPERTTARGGRAVPAGTPARMPEAIERALGWSHVADALRRRLAPDPVAPPPRPAADRPPPAAVTEADIARTYADAARRYADAAAELADAAAELRLRGDDAEAEVAAWFDGHPDHPRAAALRHALAVHNRTRDQLRALATRVGDPPAASPLADWLGALARVPGAAPIVVAFLPDDTAAASAADARALGLRAVDLRAALDTAGAAAWLPTGGLAPEGHAAVAGAIADALAAPAPARAPDPGLPAGRTRVPDPAERALGEPLTGPGDAWAGCDARRIREWLWLRCDLGGPVSVTRAAGPLETWTGVRGSQAQVLSPLVRGRALDVTLHAGAASRSLTVTWEGAEPTVALRRVAASPADPPSPSRCDEALAGRPADPGRGCDTHTDGCDALVSCATGARDPRPVCADDTLNAGSADLCHARCDDRPCTDGVCTDWMGAKVCL